MSTEAKEYTGLESQFFTWKGWDDVSTAEYNFYQCELKKDIGNFKVGDTIPCAFFSVERSLMEFYDEEGNVVGKFNLKIDAEPWDLTQE